MPRPLQLSIQQPRSVRCALWGYLTCALPVWAVFVMGRARFLAVLVFGRTRFWPCPGLLKKLAVGMERVESEGKRDVVNERAYESYAPTCERTAASFARPHRVLALDRRGHGRTDWDPDPRTPTSRIRRCSSIDGWPRSLSYDGSRSMVVTRGTVRCTGCYLVI